MIAFIFLNWNRMTREAFVKKTDSGQALVCPADTSECNSCEAKHACMVISGGKKRDLSFWVSNTAGAKEGDRVKLELKASASITIILTTFMVPILLLFAGYLFMLNGSDGERAIGAGAGLLAGIAIAILANRKLSSRRNFSLHIVRILQRADGSPSEDISAGKYTEG